MNGSTIRIRCDGCTVDAVVSIASENRASLMLSFEAILAGHVGMMPLLAVDDPPGSRYRSIMNNVLVEILP
jgi:hypothetical protein